jgi:hypothetical protein
LIESKARLEQNADFQDAGLDVGMADGAQEALVPTMLTKKGSPVGVVLKSRTCTMCG